MTSGRTDGERRTLGDRVLAEEASFRGLDEAVDRVHRRFVAAHQALEERAYGSMTVERAGAVREEWDRCFAALRDVTRGFLTLAGRGGALDVLFDTPAAGRDSPSLEAPDPVTPPDDAETASAGVGPPTDL